MTRQQAAKSPSAAIQRACFTRMRADDELTRLLGGPGRILDDVPEKLYYPYISIGAAIETTDNDLTSFGHVNLLTFDIWSEYRGYAQALDIKARVLALFVRQPLPVAGHRTVMVREDQARTLRDPNPRLRHVPVALRVTTEQLD